MTGSTRRGVAVAGVVAVAGGLLGLFVHAKWVAPFTRLPRPEAEILADWERARVWLPEARPAAAWDPALAGILTAVRYDASEAPASDEALEPILAWLDRQEPLPALSCSLLADPAPEVSSMVLFDVGRELVRSGYPEHAADLGARMRHAELLGLMVGTALVRQATAELDDPGPWAPRPEHLFTALTWEAACADAMFDAKAFDLELDVVSRAFLDLDVERLRLRDVYGRLLTRLHPIRGDAKAMRRVFEELDGAPDRTSPLTGILTIGVASVARDYLEELDEPSL